MNVGIIPLSAIDFGTRRREEYGDLDELIMSIKKQGLIQPLAVAELSSPDTPDKPYLLLAGGRRFKALEAAGSADVPVRIYSRDIDELELRSIELAENLYRKDLEWTEQVKLQREIHELQVALHGEKISTSPDAKGWSLKDTAELVGMSNQSVQKDVQLARALEAAPEVFESCKNKSDAAKILKSVSEDMIRAEMVKRAKSKPTASATKSLLDCYIIGDFFEKVPDIPDGSINFVELDPPYAIALKSAKQRKTRVLEDYNEMPADTYLAKMGEVLRESYRIMTDHSYMIMWFAPEPWLEDIYKLIISAGFSTNRMCGVWIKPTGQTNRPESNLGNAYEMFFIIKKGSPALIKQGRSNVFQFSPVPHQKKIHPTERPTELIQELLETFCSPGARICVPFLGSGNTILSAHNANMSAFGYDLATEYKDRYILKVHKLGEI